MLADLSRAETLTVNNPRDHTSWRRVSFGDVVRNSDDYIRDPVAAGIERFVGLDHLDGESLQIRRWGQVADGTTFTRRFKAGQVLFGKRRAYQRKVAVADFDGICSGDILVFEPANDDLLPELLPFIVQSEGFFQHALGTSAGSLSPRTRWNDLRKYEFSLPPKSEQRRVVEILTTTDQAREAWVAVQESLGALARQLGGNLFRHSGDTFSTLGSIASDGMLEFQTGPFGTMLKASTYSHEGTPLINPVNIIDGSLVTENGPFLPPEVSKRLGNYRLLEGDIVLGRKGDVGVSPQ